MNGRGHIPEELERLLGGYATGTLSEEEHARLMKAALENQALFDALMDEEALRETLAEPASKRALIAALEPPIPWWRKPWVWAPSMGAVAVTVLLGVVLVRQYAPFRQTKAFEVAQHREQPAAGPMERNVEAPAAAAPAGKASDTLKRRAEAPAQAKRWDAPMPAKEVEALEKDKALATPAVTQVASNLAVPKPPEAAAPPPVKVAATIGEDTRVTEPRMRQEVKGTGALAADQVGKAEEAIRVAVAFQQADGSWREVDAAAGLPAGRAIRLTATAPRDGYMMIGPKPSIGQRVTAGQPAMFTLPAQAAGELLVRVTLSDQALAAAQGEGGAMAFRAAQPQVMDRATRAKTEARKEAVSLEAVGGARADEKKSVADAVAAPPILIRELRLRFVE